MNATWNMSSKEVERANDTKLKDGIAFAFIESGINNLLDLNRITSKEVEKINLWTFNADLSYEFFDDRLFRYSFTGQVYEPNKFDSVAIHNLGLSYGKITKDTAKYDGKYFKDSVLVEYYQWDMENAEKKEEHRFLIEVTFQPIFNEIIRTAEKEQQSIFH